jgi:PAS domain S-box-containing protein
MKYQVLDHIFNKQKLPTRFESLEVDENFYITDTSEQVKNFAARPQEAIAGKDVRLAFPELVGLEEVLRSVLEGEQELFELEEINRFSEHQSEIYINIYFISEASRKGDKKYLIILIEDVTERMILKQKLLQQANEANLLSSVLISYKNYMDKVIASMADALILTNKSGRIKRVNRVAIELFGYSEPELMNQQISILMDDNNKFFQEAIQQNYLFKNNCQSVEIVCRTKTGEKLLISFSCSVMQKKIDGLEDIIYIGRDITAKQNLHKRDCAQYAITKILSKSKNIKQAIPQILQAICESLEWDLGELWTSNQYIAASENKSGINPVLRCVEIWSGRTVTVREFKAITWQTTYTLGVGLPGRIWATRFPEWFKDVVEDHNCVRSQFAHAAGLHAAFGFPIFSKNEIYGVMIFFSRDVQPRDADLLQVMLSIGSQIAQFIKRKQAEEALLESEERYRDLFENANDLIQSVTPQGNFVYVNRAWRETLGYSEAEIAQMNVFDIIHPDFRAKYRHIFHRMMSGEKFEQVEVAFITKNGEKIFVEGKVNCKVAGGKPVANRGIFRNITRRVAAEEALRRQQEQTERLLLNIFPQEITNRLKQQPSTIAEDFADVTVLFADIVGFTEIASGLNATQLVNLLNQIFSVFDYLSEKYGLEKIKTIGDAYMVVGGLPTRHPNHPQAIAHMALDMLDAIAKFNTDNQQKFSIRIGIHTGPVVAGVIGIKKFTYDLWGDTVNIASRMESQGLAGKIQVTEVTYKLLRDEFYLEKRGEILIKGKGKMMTYLLTGRKC